jgi:hypothetical protein
MKVKTTVKCITVNARKRGIKGEYECGEQIAFINTGWRKFASRRRGAN